MANEFKIRKGLIVEGATGGTVVDVQGSLGQLFSVTDNLTGEIFAVADISGVPIMSVNSNGKVGIGTINPGSVLSLEGNQNLFSLKRGTSGDQTFFMSADSARLYFSHTDTQSGNLILTLYDNKEAVFSGDVGIGVTGPNFKLDVAGTFGVSDLPSNATSTSVLVANETLGSELITNGDFATDTAWTKEAGWSIGSGVASYNGSSSNNALYENLSLTTGTKYKLAFTIVNYVSGTLVGALSSGSLDGNTPNITANGKYAFDLTAAGVLCIFRSTSSFSGSIDNVSLKQITSASDQIQKRELGSSAFADTEYWKADGNDIYNTNSANVGIGTDSPGAKLDVFSAASFRADVATGNPLISVVNNTATSNVAGTATIKFTQANTQTGGKIVSARDGDYSSGATRASNLQFYTSTGASDSLKMIINSLGNVGIGDTAPSSISANTFSLSVNSSRNDLSGALLTKANGTIKHQQYWDSSGYGFNLSASSGAFRWKVGNVEKMTVPAAGGLDIQGTIGQLFSVTNSLTGEIFAVADISGVPIMKVNSSGVSTFAGDINLTTPPGAQNSTFDLSCLDTNLGAYAPMQIISGGMGIVSSNSTGLFQNQQWQSNGNSIFPFYKVGFGTALPAADIISQETKYARSRDVFPQAVASQSGTTITSISAIFTADMVGKKFVWLTSAFPVEANGVMVPDNSTTTFISAFVSSTVLTATTSQTVAQQTWEIFTPGVYTTNRTDSKVSPQLAIGIEGKGSHPFIIKTTGEAGSMQLAQTTANAIPSATAGLVLSSNGNITSDNSLTLAVNDPSKEIINLVGNKVGVGITSISPSGNLTVESSGNQFHLRANTAPAGKYWNFDVTSNNQLFIITDAGTGINIDNLGNVGIGITDPDEALEIGAEGHLKLSRGDNARSMELYTDGSYGTIETDVDPILIKSANRIDFQINGGTEAMRIALDGNIGMGGNTNPGNALEVTGIIEATVGDTGGFAYGANPPTKQGLMISVSNTGGDAFSGAGRLENTSTANSSSAVLVLRQTNSAAFSTITQYRQGSGTQGSLVGFVRVTTTNTIFSTSSSDERLKKNITNWTEDTLGKFKALQPKKFRYKIQDASEEKTLGFIAQNEVANFPEAYVLNKENEEDEAMYSFNPMGMTTHLMKAIKDLVEKVEILENKITQLEN